jgi:hypothetical protein
MADHEGFPIRELWEKYEDIAMHFNDLIIRLRTQALAGVAALSTLVGIFAKTDLGSFSYTWEIAGFVFSGLTLFWIAIWVLDFGYYNRLLIGAVAALLELEKLSATATNAPQIRLSTVVEDSSRSGFKLRASWAGWVFYIIVFGALVCGAVFSFDAHLYPPAKPIAFLTD